MMHTSDSLTQWALTILFSVICGTFALIAVAFIRRWQQLRYARYIHELQRRYRPILMKLLRGEQRPTGIEALRELPLGEAEILLDPLCPNGSSHQGSWFSFKPSVPNWD